MHGLFPGFTEIPAETSNAVWAKWSVVQPHMKRPLVTPWSVWTWDDVATLNETVNRFVTYRSDPGDRWQSPQETYLVRQGDCEDFSILKWKILADDLPSAEFAMVLGAVIDVDHAFLVVRWEGKARVLDNRFDQLIDPADYFNLQPKVLVCADAVFRYVKPFTIADVVKKAGPANGA